MCTFCPGDAFKDLRCHSCIATFDICQSCIDDWQPCHRCGEAHCRPHMKFPGLCLVCWSLVEGYAERRRRFLQILRPQQVQPPLQLDPFHDDQQVAPYIQPMVIVVEQPVPPVWLKLGDLAPCERLFFAYSPTVNHSAAFELLEACWALKRNVQIPDRVSLNLLLTCPPDSFVQLVPLQQPHEDFMFLQDQFILGGCFGSEPDPWRPVVRLCRRKLAGSLNKWAESQLPTIKLLEQPLELDDRLTKGPGDDQNGVEFGGNFLLSPAVTSPTDELPAGPAGPKVPPHLAAPWGKLIVGDARHPEKQCTNPEQGMSGNSLSKVTRDALCTHTLQPVVPIDTSWLLVGHVDEIISFAQGGDGPCLSVASPALMLKLLEMLHDLWPKYGSLTCLHAGKSSGEDHHEQAPSDLLTRKDYNLDIHQNAIAPIVERLKATTGVVDVLELPVWFEPSMHGKPLHQTKAHAETVDVVNMIVLPGAVIVPRPYGPRLPFDAAAQIVSVLAGRCDTKPTARPFHHWPGPGETLLKTACIFAPCPAEHHEARRDALVFGKTDGWLRSDPIVQLARQIADRNGITISSLDDLSQPLGLCRLQIPLDHVDVVEWLIAECYAARGIHCEFADDWIYHRNAGELHCGSNSIRTPPLDWPPIDPRKAFSCPYDETTVEPPRPSGPIEFKNQEKVIVSLNGEDKPGVALMNRKPQDPANMFVRIDGKTVEVACDSVRRA